MGKNVTQNNTNRSNKLTKLFAAFALLILILFIIYLINNVSVIKEFMGLNNEITQSVVNSSLDDAKKIENYFNKTYPFIESYELVEKNGQNKYLNIQEIYNSNNAKIVKYYYSIIIDLYENLNESLKDKLTQINLSVCNNLNDEIFSCSMSYTDFRSYIKSETSNKSDFFNVTLYDSSISINDVIEDYKGYNIFTANQAKELLEEYGFKDNYFLSIKKVENDWCFEFQNNLNKSILVRGLDSSVYVINETSGKYSPIMNNSISMNEEGIKEITVRNTAELVSAIDSNTIVYLKEGIYDLNYYYSFLNSGNSNSDSMFMKYVENPRLTNYGEISGIQNLKIVGLSENVLVKKGFSFSNCSNIYLMNINVSDITITIARSNAIYIKDCSFTHSNYGISLYGSSNVQIDDSIFQNTYKGLASIVTSDNVDFSNCIFEKCSGGIMTEKSVEISFNNSVFEGLDSIPVFEDSDRLSAFDSSGTFFEVYKDAQTIFVNKMQDWLMGVTIENSLIGASDIPEYFYLYSDHKDDNIQSIILDTKGTLKISMNMDNDKLDLDNLYNTISSLNSIYELADNSSTLLFNINDDKIHITLDKTIYQNMIKGTMLLQSFKNGIRILDINLDTNEILKSIVPVMSGEEAKTIVINQINQQTTDLEEKENPNLLFQGCFTRGADIIYAFKRIQSDLEIQETYNYEVNATLENIKIDNKIDDIVYYRNLKTKNETEQIYINSMKELIENIGPNRELILTKPVYNTFDGIQNGMVLGPSIFISDNEDIIIKNADGLKISSEYQSGSKIMFNNDGQLLSIIESSNFEMDNIHFIGKGSNNKAFISFDNCSNLVLKNIKAETELGKVVSLNSINNSNLIEIQIDNAKEKPVEVINCNDITLNLSIYQSQLSIAKHPIISIFSSDNITIEDSIIKDNILDNKAVMLDLIGNSNILFKDSIILDNTFGFLMTHDKDITMQNVNKNNNQLFDDIKFINGEKKITSTKQFFDALQDDVILYFDEINLDLGQYTMDMVEGNEFIRNVGGRLIFNNLKNIRFEGSGADKTYLLQGGIFEPVMTFSKCENIEINNLYMKQSKISSDTANVLDFSNTSNININNCILDNSGALGISITKVNNFSVSNTIIQNCSLGILYSQDSSLINFSNCTLQDNDGFNKLNIINSTDITFKNCLFSRNESYSYEDNTVFTNTQNQNMPVIFDGCIFKDNKEEYFANSELDIILRDTEFINNLFLEGFFVVPIS